MTKYLLKRILYIFVVFVILSFLMYLIYNMIPFNRADWLADQVESQYKKDPEGWAALRKAYHVQLGYTDAAGNKINIVRRWLNWLGVTKLNGQYNGLLQGNFGTSYSNGTRKPVMDVLKDPMKNTIFINIFATILALGITIPLGIFCAVKKGSKRDTAVQIGSIIGYRLYYMALPLIVMTFCSLGGMTRYVRASMIESLSMDCIRTARAKGVKEKTVIYSHAFRNALIPIVTLVVGWFLGIFSGSVMIENIFGLTGMGKVYINALSENNFDVVLTLQMFYVFISLAGNLLIDILYGFIDPRIRVSA